MTQSGFVLGRIHFSTYERCEDGIPVALTNAVCCSRKKGAFKRTLVKNEYIHVLCARWNPSIWSGELEPIAIPKWLLNRKVCCICQKVTGLTAPCSKKGCTNSFHVTCAIKTKILEKLPLRYVSKDKLGCHLHYAEIKDQFKNIIIQSADPLEPDFIYGSKIEVPKKRELYQNDALVSTNEKVKIQKLETVENKSVVSLSQPTPSDPRIEEIKRTIAQLKKSESTQANVDQLKDVPIPVAVASQEKMVTRNIAESEIAVDEEYISQSVDIWLNLNGKLSQLILISEKLQEDMNGDILSLII